MIGFTIQIIYELITGDTVGFGFMTGLNSALTP